MKWDIFLYPTNFQNSPPPNKLSELLFLSFLFFLLEIHLNMLLNKTHISNMHGVYTRLLHTWRYKDQTGQQENANE